MNDVKDLMTQAIGALKAGRKDKAYRLFSKVVDLDQTNEDALLGKAGCSSDLDETILLLEKILAMNPSSEKAREGLEWATERRRALSEVPVGVVAQDEERPSAKAVEGVREETEEAGSKQRQAGINATVIRAVAVLSGLFGLFNGVKNWMISATYPASYGDLYGAPMGRGFSDLLFAIVAKVVLWEAIGLVSAAITLSLFNSAQEKLRRFGIKHAGLLVPLILLFLAGVIGALLGIHSWATYSLTENFLLRLSGTPSGDLLALVLEMVESVATFGPIMFVGAMVAWWVVVALWSRLRG